MNLLKYTWVALIAVACTSSQAQAYQKIDNTKLETLMENEQLQLLDVRTPEEVAAGFIEGAKHIDIYDPAFIEKVSQLDKEQPIAVYCAAGGRSALAGQKLKEMGFKEIYDLTGGYRGWVGAGKPIVKDK